MDPSSSSSSENSTQFQFVDLILIFHSLLCFDTLKSFFLRNWSFPQSKHQQDGWSKKSELNHNSGCSVFSPEKNRVDDGRVYREDMEKLMGNLGLFCSHESDELNESFSSDDFCRLFDEEPSLEEVKLTFDVFDVNKDGFIDAEELQRVLGVLGLKEGLKMENCEKMIQRFDEDGDGRIDFREFVKFMENSFC